MLKNKLLILNFFVICFFSCFLFSYEYIGGKELISKYKIYNYDVANNIIVYEHDENYIENGIHYISFYNIKTRETYRILSNTGDFINSSLYFPSISEDGNYITFTSRATNITDDIIGDCLDITDNSLKKCSNIYVYNVNEKKSKIIRYENEMLNGDSFISKISGNGRNIVFESLSNNFLNKANLSCKDLNGIDNCINIYKYNTLTEKINLISTGKTNQGADANSISPSVSDDGRFVTFQSVASNITNSNTYNSSCIVDNKNTCSNIFLVDTLNQTSIIISKRDNELLNNNSGNSKISGNGLFVFYESYATNIDINMNKKQHIILYDVQNDKNKIISKEKGIFNNRDSYMDDISYDGKYLSFRTRSTNLDNINNIMNLYIYNIENENVSKIKELKNDILISLINDNQIYYYDDNDTLNIDILDCYSPIIEKSQKLYVLKDNANLIKEKIAISDNLSSREKIDIYIDNLSILDNFGKYDLEVTAIDEFGNISKETIEIIVLEKDEEGPIFNEINEIKILKGSSVINLANYVTATDKIDGNTRIYIVDDGEVNLDITGEYKIKIMAKDNANNASYKELTIYVYENYDFTYFYEIILILGILIVIIFSIIRVK